MQPVIDVGVLKQVDSPQKLFDEPDNLFVAAFIGSPSMNLLEGKLVQDGSVTLQLGSDSLEVPPEMFAGRESLRGFFGKDLVVGLRPKDFYYEQIDRYPVSQRMRARVSNLESLGHERMVYFSVDAPRVVSDELAVEETDVVSSAGGTLLTARFSAHSLMSIGDDIDVAVDVAKAHFFDPDTGLAIRD